VQATSISTLVSLLAPPAARDETEGRRRAGLYSGIGSNEIELSSVDLASRRPSRGVTGVDLPPTNPKVERGIQFCEL
jgi:hypothetical protein